jgi:signal transduction histidine kinase
LLTYSEVSNYNSSIEQFINNSIYKYEKKIEFELLEKQRVKITDTINILTDSVSSMSGTLAKYYKETDSVKQEKQGLEQENQKLESENAKYYNERITGLSIFIIVILTLLIFLYVFYYNKKLQKKKHLAEKESLEKTYELEKLKILETAVAGLIHDMRQSTSIIRGCSSKIQQWIDDETKTLKDDKLKYQVNKIEESIRKVVELTNNYMIIQTDRVQNESKDIILNEYIQLIITNYNSVLKKHQVKTNIISDDDIRIALPPGFIVEIFENLINNSIEHGFTEDQGDNRQITIKISKENDKVKMEFENNGKKIDNNIIFDIFKPYFSTKDKGGFNGIGLSKVKNLVENGLEGKITCENIEEGVRFLIVLPLKQIKNEK